MFTYIFRFLFIFKFVYLFLGLCFISLVVYNGCDNSLLIEFDGIFVRQNLRKID